MDRRRFLIGGAGLAGLATVGCGEGEEEEPSGPSSRRVTRPAQFAIVPKMLNNPVFTLAQRGAEKAARELGNIEVLYQGSQTGVAAEQVDVIRQLTQRKVKGMSISVIDANAAREAIDEAVAQGIEVICFDSDCPDSKRKTFTGVDNKVLGKELVTQLVASIGSENMDGEIAMLSGQASAPNLQDRLQAAAAELASYPRVKVLETLYCDDKEDVAIEKIRSTMSAHPVLRGWVMVGGWALFRPNALDSVLNSKRTRIVSVDALPEELNYVEKDQVACLLAQRCFAWGEDSIKILNRLRTEAWTPPKFIDAGFDIILKDPTGDQRRSAEARKLKIYSVSEYRSKWEEWNKAA